MKRLYFSILIALLTLSIHAQITSPQKYLGYQPGDDFHLATSEQLAGYLELLSQESDKVKLFDMGPTTEGRRMKYVVISSAKNILNLEKYKEITRKLSLVRGLSKAEAKALAAEGKVFVWIDSGIHSTETSPSMHQFQLAYDLVNGNDPKTESILDNVILLLVEANPDGMTSVADWYKSNLNSNFEMSQLPILYNKYAGHDNNRDTYIANLIETQNMNHAIGKEWFPELIYIQHESAPFPARIWLPPAPEPVNPNTHPMVLRWKNLVGSAMAQAFEESGQTGAISRTAFDLWFPGYTDGSSVEGHNIPSILTETANFGFATPHFYSLYDFPEAYRDLTMGVFYTSPWEGGWWRFKDAVDYDITASIAVLDVASKYRYELLYYKYQVGEEVIERFKNEPPYGWIFPAEQADPGNTTLLMNRLIDYGIEVYRSNEPLLLNGISYSKGSYIIPTSQPFGLYVKNVLEEQDYPDLRKYNHLWQGISRPIKWDGAPLTPYEGVGWTLPLQMGIKADKMSTGFEENMSLISEAIAVKGKVVGSGSGFLISATENNSYKAINEVLAVVGKVSYATEDFKYAGISYPKGTFIIESGKLPFNKLNEIASKTQTTLIGGNFNLSTKPVRKPRIALYKSWVANIDAGWISYVFDNYDFPYHALTDAEVKAGNLAEQFDVLVLPDQRFSSILNGNKKGSIPLDYVGGITLEGIDNIKEFVKEGGTLICNNQSCDLAIETFKLPIKDILKDMPSDTFNCPGSILKLQYENNSALSSGMGEKGAIYFSRGRVFEMMKDSLKRSEPTNNIASKIIATYPDESLLLSGWMLGEELIRNKAAVMEVTYGKGKIVLFGFNVVNRAQSYATFKLLFNAILKN